MKNLCFKEFINFWSLGEIVSKKNKQIIKEGQKQKHLLLILSGKVQVKKNNKLINILNRGNFPGIALELIKIRFFEIFEITKPLERFLI